MCLAAALTACGQSAIRPDATARLISDLVFMHTGFRPHDVRCPSGVPAKVGSTFDCRFTGPDGHYIAHVLITNVHGQRATDYVIVRRSGT
jgi:hypothetical protein